jgi:hypothetical protein
MSGGASQSAGLALGGVAPKPLGLLDVEAFLAGAEPRTEVFRQAAEIALDGTRPVKQNSFKLDLAKHCVVRATPPALAALKEPDCRVTVAVPSYGFLHRLPESRMLSVFDFVFAGAVDTIELYDVPGEKQHSKVRDLVLLHPRFECLDP